MNLIERRRRKLIIFTILCVLVFALFIGALVRNGRVEAAVCLACTSHPELSPATCEKPPTCPYCGYQKGLKLGHTKPSEPTCLEAGKCTRCGKATGKPALGHQYTYTSFGAGLHRLTCSRCGASMSGTTEGCTYNDNGSCTKCGYTKAGSSGASCEHTYKWIPDGFDMHRHICSKCGSTEPGSYETCTYVNGICTKCGVSYICEHSYQWASDGTYRHSKVCSKCRSSLAGSSEECSYDTNGKCTKCGAELPGNQDTTNCDHIWEYTRFGSTTAHMVYCEKCGCKPHWEEHKYNDFGVCTKCGFIQKDLKDAPNYGDDNCNHDSTTTESCGSSPYHVILCNKCWTIWYQAHSFDNNGTCSKCGYTRKIGDSEEKPENCNHEMTNINVGTTGHMLYCKICGGNRSYEGHKYNDSGECTVCGALKGNSDGTPSGNPGGSDESGCEHTYVTKYDKTNHWKECSKCGFVKADSIVEHAYNENGKCECGATKQVEETCEHTYVTQKDETYHWEECSKCKEIKTNSKEEHSYTNGKCKCGATKQVEETCEHTYVTKKDAAYHWEECSKCKEIKTNSKEKHSYTNGKCSKCGIEDPNKAETCEHTYVTKSDATYHWEECSKCKEIKTNSKEKHKGIKWTDEGNGTHSGTCSVCNFKLKEEHSYTNGKCTECGVEESSKNETCEHKYAEKHDETYHWEECSKCNDLKKGTLQTHKYKEYTDNKNGTHTTTCTICGYKLTEEHLTECEKCNKQANTGNKENDNTDNNDNNKENNNIDKNGSKDEDNTNNDKKDNTAIDKNLPYTGTSKIITLIIIMLSASIIVTVFKLKKYKGIK